MNHNQQQVGHVALAAEEGTSLPAAGLTEPKRDQRGLRAEPDTATDPSLWCDVTKDSYLSCA
jgi:hypothetical protein